MPPKVPCKRCGATDRKLLSHRNWPVDGFEAYPYAAPRLAGVRCTTCWRALRAERKTAAATKRRAKTYGGMTAEEFEGLKAFQNGRCGLCFRNLGPKAVVDHRHSDGLVRGILCGANCNRNVLGIFAGDDPMVFRNAALYLEQPPAAFYGMQRYGKRTGDSDRSADGRDGAG